MRFLLPFVVSMIAVGLGHADSGGPYEGVPDMQETERPPVFKIPSAKKPLEFYLKHMPRLAWNKEHSEPDSYTWEPIDGYHASFRILGHVRGHRILELRYISRERIAQGLDYADILMLLAKGQDTEPDENLCRAIYFTSGGVTYNHTAEYLQKGDKYGAVVVTRHYSGSGAHRDLVGIRGTEGFEFERFDPANEKAEQNGAVRPLSR
ncbi:MAG: hypothetical protein ACI957_001115 [Verrucomicrobiales bacterium]|jgi:hypothetical protein